MSDALPQDPAALRTLATQCQDAGWELLQSAPSAPEEIARLVGLAATARHVWSEVGTPLQVARAETLHGWALAIAGAGPAARSACEAASWSLGEADEATPFDHALAKAALSAAAHANDDSTAHAGAYEAAQEMAASLTGDDAAQFKAVFATIPQPG